MTKFFLKIFAGLMLGFVASGALADGGIEAKDAWVQAAPPGVKVLAAYLEIKNNGKQQQILTGISSTAFGKIEIHRSVIHGNMAHMEHLKELVISPDASTVLQPGGTHLMLMDAKKALKIGDQIPMTLTFDKGAKITVNALVRSGKMDGMEDHRQMDHSGHGGHKH